MGQKRHYFGFEAYRFIGRGLQRRHVVFEAAQPNIHERLGSSPYAGSQRNIAFNVCGIVDQLR